MTEDLVNTDISTEELLGIEQPNVSEVEGETTQAINADHGGDEDALLPREGSPVEESSVPKRKRRRRSRKSAAFQAFEEELCEDDFEPTHQPFHRVVFDDEGNACEVVLRTNDTSAQVNRKQQKRLATSNYRWSAGSVNGQETMTRVGKRKGPPQNPQSPPFKVARNLDVRIHKLPNDYDTVVGYWYATLEWMDKAAYEASQMKPPEEACGHEEEVLEDNDNIQMEYQSVSEDATEDHNETAEVAITPEVCGESTTKTFNSDAFKESM